MRITIAGNGGAVGEVGMSDRVLSICYRLLRLRGLLARAFSVVVFARNYDPAFVCERRFVTRTEYDNFYAVIPADTNGFIDGAALAQLNDAGFWFANLAPDTATLNRFLTLQINTMTDTL
jgi:hypothetical protein